MSITTESMTPADIRACTCGNDGYNNGNFANDWTWLIILALFGGGFGGFGGFGGGGILPWLLFGNGTFGGQGGCGCSPCATQADLAAGFNNSAVLNNLDGIENALCQGFNGVNTALLQGFAGVDNAVCTLGYNMQGGFNALSAQLAQCCCDNRAAIADVKYTIANEGCDTRHTIYNSTRDIIDNANANSRAILDFLTQDKISTLTAENQALKFQASQTAQNAVLQAAMDANTATILRRTGAECPVPAYVVSAPTPVNFPTNCCGQVQFASPCNTGCGSF